MKRKEQRAGAVPVRSAGTAAFCAHTVYILWIFGAGYDIMNLLQRMKAESSARAEGFASGGTRA
ncbi:hypothetical protein [Allofournierella massiliensis]|uniref:hypothetical protein n=1 Tax=Allofournierella massiliensis TaxID=1650663 RepID=UPI00356722CD